MLARLLFIALFVLSINPRKVADDVALFVIVGLFALTNGYITSTRAPSLFSRLAFFFFFDLCVFLFLFVSPSSLVILL